MADEKQTQQPDNSEQWLNWAANSFGHTLSPNLAALLLPHFRYYTALGYDFGSAFLYSVEQVTMLIKQESR